MKINIQLPAQSKNKEMGGLKESVSNEDRSKTDLNDISEIDLTGFSLRGAFEKRKEAKVDLR